MSKKDIDGFKEVLHQGMKMNFEMAGFLTPIMFFYKAGQPIITEIPNEYLASEAGKQGLAQIIRKLCSEPDTIMAGIIIEAYGAKIQKDGKDAEAVLSGEKKVRELEDKQDIIIMIVSTPEGEEAISYIVDPKAKTIGEEFTGAGLETMKGTFSNFFNWNKN